jgi:DNA primase
MGHTLSPGHSLLLSTIMGDHRDLVVLFDGDDAGHRGAEAAGRRLDDMGLKVRTAALPDGHDPDRFVRVYGEGALRGVIEAACG